MFKIIIFLKYDNLKYDKFLKYTLIKHITNKIFLLRIEYLILRTKYFILRIEYLIL